MDSSRSPHTRSNSLPDPSSSSSTSQSLASILNNPNASSSSSWSAWWSSSASVAAPPEFLPLLPKSASDSLTRSDFRPYLSSISDQYNRFDDILNHLKKENLDDLDSIGGQGEALVACLREVPALYFKEDFALEDGATFKSACLFSGAAENLVLQEKLTHYLDVVELHLVKEISLRSNSFFEAQGQLEDLNVKIVEGCNRIRELKETISLLDVDLVDSARQIQELNVTRSNLLALQQKLRLILYVNQALSALKLVSGEELPENNWTSELLEVIIRKLGAVDESFTISLANKNFKAELCIYRVPEKPVKEDDYSPRVVAIGPFHRKNGNLAAMSQHKMFYMISFLHQNGSGLNPVECLRQCIDAIHGLDEAIRLCYFENIDYTNSELAEMMLIDGCFILELFLRNHLSSDYIMENEFGTDLVLRSAWIATALKHDLALLENQIPFILEILYSILHPVIEKRCRAPKSVAVLALKFFKPMSEKVITEEVVPECMHLLDLLHKFYFTPVPGVFLTNIGNDIESNTNPEKGIPEKWGFDNCASELLESAGIEFREGSNPEGSLLNITLYQLHPNVVINMPKLLIHNTSISLFRNLIAFEERSLGSTKSVTSYAFLLRSLICSSKDSRLLKERGVIENISNGDEEFFVTKFRSIVDGVDLMDYCFQEVCDRVNDEYHKSWSILNRLKTIFREQIRFLWVGYLFSAWKIMSILAAAAILILTSLQTYYTINPRK